MSQERAKQMIPLMNWGDGLLGGVGAAIVTLVRARAFSHSSWTAAAREAVVAGLLLGLVFAASASLWTGLRSVLGPQGVSAVAIGLILVVVVVGGLAISPWRRRRMATRHSDLGG